MSDNDGNVSRWNPVDRRSREAERLAFLLAELGIDTYGYVNTDFDDASWLRTRAIGTDDGNVVTQTIVIDPKTGNTLMVVVPYWWGDDDRVTDLDEWAGYDWPEEPVWDDDDDTVKNGVRAIDIPNLYVPSLKYGMEWYKYYDRDAGGNLPFDYGLVERIVDVLKPALMEARKRLPHYEERDVTIDWTPDGDNAEHTSMDGMSIAIELKRGFHGDGKDVWAATIGKDMSYVGAMFDTREDAKEWCERQFETSLEPPDEDDE